jgi:4-amino-4-deoxy-L-arabinose transferase-like glycosyltransferase
MRVPRDGRLVWLLGVTLGVLVAGRLATVFAVSGNVNQDEGWYLYAANLLYHGQLPYRDFAFFQAPLLPALYGLPQLLFGPGLWIGRLTSLALTAVTLALAFRIAHERAGRLAALTALLLLPLAPLALWASTSTRTEPLTAALWMAAAWLLLRQPAGPAASGGALLAAVLAVAARVSSLPAAGLIVALVVARHRGSRRDLAVALAPALGAGLVLVGFLLVCGPEAVYFDLVTAQALRHTQLQPAEAWTLGQAVETRLAALSALPGRYGIVPPAALLAGLAAGVLWLRRRPGLETRLGGAASLALLAAAVYLPNLAPRAVYPVYFASAYPLCAVLVACVLGWAFERASGPQRGALALAALALLAFQLSSFGERFGVDASLAEPDLAEVQRVGRELAQLVPEGAKLVTLDTYLAVESRRPVVAGFEMGLFAWSPAWPAEWTSRFALATPALWEEALRDPSVGAVVLSDFAIGILARGRLGGHRPRQLLSERQLRRLLPGLERFRLEKVVPSFGQFDDPLYILVPRFTAARPSLLAPREPGP